MSLGTNLTTNEVRDSSGTEVEFLQLTATGSSRTLAKSGEAPNLPTRLTISHQESGQLSKRRRRSVVRFDVSFTGDDPLSSQVVQSAYIVLDSPVGVMSTMDVAKKALAYLGSLVFTTGSSTHLYDGTGTGADALLKGALQT